MKTFNSFLKEEAEGEKLKHIHHAEDRPLMHGHAGFEHAYGALQKAHAHMTSGHKSSNLTMKYDGSPSIVFGHHPKTGKFFVATKSAFNKNPKINHTEKDIDKNHGHAPGLAKTLKHALKHLPKVTPKHGVYQGDLMHHAETKTLHESVIISEATKAHKVSFTPNTITYTAHGKEAEKIKKSKVGVVVHSQYHGTDIHNMHVSHHPDTSHFKEHPDVHWHGAEHDTSKVKHSDENEHHFQKHMAAAKEIHDTHGHKMYDSVHHKHGGEAGHLSTYINKTVRHDEVPSVKGFKEHLKDVHEKQASKVKTDKAKAEKTGEGHKQIAHVEKHKEHYGNLFAMHHHLHQAKNALVKSLETHEGHYQHHISGKKSKPEGFVVSHTHNGKEEPTKLVNRAEFAKQNLLKVRK
jgi:Family of unknown function (DUF6267)